MLCLASIGKAFIECISQLLKYNTVKLENQETTIIIKDKEKLEQAGNIAEQIIGIALKYKSLMSRRDQRKLKSLVKRFNKFD